MMNFKHMYWRTRVRWNFFLFFSVQFFSFHCSSIIVCGATTQSSIKMLTHRRAAAHLYILHDCLVSRRKSPTLLKDFAPRARFLSGPVFWYCLDHCWGVIGDWRHCLRDRLRLYEAEAARSGNSWNIIVCLQTRKSRVILSLRSIFVAPYDQRVWYFTRAQGGWRMIVDRLAQYFFFSFCGPLSLMRHAATPT
jgi:hypothetical protein